MFEILITYGIPITIVNAIKILYKDTTASVVTPEGETEPFTIRTGVLQGDPLAPFLFIVLDYALRTSITSNHGFTLKRRQSCPHPTEHLSDLDYADNIALIKFFFFLSKCTKNKIHAYQSLLRHTINLL